LPLQHEYQALVTKFTSVRSKLEEILVTQKDLIATILQKHVSARRVEKYVVLLEGLIDDLSKGKEIAEGRIVELSGLDGKVVLGSAPIETNKFSDDVKSETFIRTALVSAIKCPICNGYLDSEKSVSYDHVQRVREDGQGGTENCQLTHPYCNQSIKN
jgi:hypothetical protein